MKSKTKIIRLPIQYFAMRKHRPLSKLMVATLLNAWTKQTNGISFGPVDTNGSFSPLVSRGLIKHKSDRKGGFTWYVTDEAIELLKSQGLSAPDLN
jgi:hypothetical protein